MDEIAAEWDRLHTTGFGVDTRFNMMVRSAGQKGSRHIHVSHRQTETHMCLNSYLFRKSVDQSNALFCRNTNAHSFSTQPLMVTDQLNSFTFTS